MNRMCRGAPILVWLAVASVPAFAQPNARPGEKAPPEVDPAKVDEAVGKGAEWIRAQLKAGLPPPKDVEDDPQHAAGQTYNEIVLYTLLHAGVDRGDPDVINLVQAIRSKPPVHTYSAALRAMAFELYDPVKLRPDLILTAQFLVDNQAHNGQWSYGKEIPWPPLPKVIFTQSSNQPNYVSTGPRGAGSAAASPRPAAPAPAEGDGAAGNAAAPPPAADKSVATAGAPVAKPSTTQIKKAPPKYGIVRRGWGAFGDNSNTQYAVLGLRACMGQGILPPPDCLSATEKWFTEHQRDDGGWGYQCDSDVNDPSMGSMTVGGLGSLAVCIRGVRNADPRKDPRIQKAVQWMAKNLTFESNPPGGNYWHYYWIYGVERAGAFSETEWFGDRPWYHDGATWLLAAQNGDGSWGHGNPMSVGRRGNQILDTCWAILFLRRATKHIVQRKVIFTQAAN